MSKQSHNFKGDLADVPKSKWVSRRQVSNSMQPPLPVRSARNQSVRRLKFTANMEEITSTIG